MPAAVQTLSLVLAPTDKPRVFRAPDGSLLAPPSDWVCLPPGDAALTRRVKLAGPSWAVIEKRGRKAFSRGLWAPAANVESIRASLESERSTEGYAKKLDASRARRDRDQAAYAMNFEEEVRAFLAFASSWSELGREMAKRIAAHATPVGSGTVARTKRISVSERAEAAVIAWMRHQTTAYDSLRIPRIAGKRREVRRELATNSRAVLDLHRKDQAHSARACPLCSALLSSSPGC